MNRDHPFDFTNVHLRERPTRAYGEQGWMAVNREQHAKRHLSPDRLMAVELTLTIICIAILVIVVFWR